MRILTIEDDPAIAQSIELMLKSESFNVYVTDRGDEGVELARLYDYDVITLDLTLPDMDGFEALRRIRLAGVKTPILILSCLSSIESKVKALGMGADYYLTKPFHKDEMVAAIYALVRRSRHIAVSQIVTGEFILDLNTKTVKVGGSLVDFTAKEYAMVEVMSLRKGMTITKEMFLNNLYGGMDEPEAKIIDVYICKIRKKLKPFGVSHLIENVWGRGYMLRDPVPVLISMAPEVADMAEDPPTGFVAPTTFSERQERHRRGLNKRKTEAAAC